VYRWPRGHHWNSIPRILFDWGTIHIGIKIQKLRASIYVNDSAPLFRQVGLPDIDHSTVSGLHFHLVPGQHFPWQEAKDLKLEDDKIPGVKELEFQKKHLEEHIPVDATSLDDSLDLTIVREMSQEAPELGREERNKSGGKRKHDAADDDTPAEKPPKKSKKSKHH
jgi:hypothetical protein